MTEDDDTPRALCNQPECTFLSCLRAGSFPHTLTWYIEPDGALHWCHMTAKERQTVNWKDENESA